MCPLCDESIGCTFWYLSDVCLFVKIAYLFDHPGTVFYAMFVSFWGKYWKFFLHLLFAGLYRSKILVTSTHSKQHC